MRLKTRIYALIVSAIISLITMAVMRPTTNEPAQTKPMTTAQQLDALGKLAPKDSQVSKIIRNEKTAVQDQNAAARDMGK